MNIAGKKREQNISEYIIHMYQTEDLIRVYHFDMDDIQKYVISHIPADEEEKAGITDWYASVRQRMQKEKIEETGHLAEVQKYVSQLSSLMEELKSSDVEFEKIYQKARPHIEENMQYSRGVIKQEVQACLNGIYGFLLARMNGRDVPEELLEGINTFGDVLSYLSYVYRERNT